MARVLPFALTLWCAAVGSGQYLLFEHATAAGDPGHPLANLPAPQRHRLALATDAPVLIVAAHPQCPCLPATLGEVQRTRAEHRQLAVRLLVHTPSTPPPAWSAPSSDALRREWPDAYVADRDGELAAALGCATSGTVLLYSGAGVLQFAGGVTQGRGHAGDNPASRALRAALRDPHRRDNPAVFGCPLNTDSAAHEGSCCEPKR